MLKKHLEGVLQFQSEDGRWHQLTNDTSSFLETSSTAMFTASLARAVRQNWVNGTFKDKCKAAALKVSIKKTACISIARLLAFTHVIFRKSALI